MKAGAGVYTPDDMGVEDTRVEDTRVGDTRVEDDARSAVHLTLLTRAGCHLCDDMKALVAAAGRARPLVLEEVDIAARRDLERRFATEIPVLMRDGTVLAQGRTTLAALLERLRQTDA